MKKNHLKMLALTGLVTGMVTAQTHADSSQNNWYNSSPNNKTSSLTQTENAPKLSQSELEQKLNPETRKIFDALAPEGKSLALKLANQSCKGMNECKGLNSCKTAENTCAGSGGCKGQSPGPIADKNMAVMVAAKHMMEERIKAMRGIQLR